MKNGLIIGKFMPPHLGHLALINFGLKHCDHLTVLVCTLNHENIPGYLRYRWIKESFKHSPNIFIDHTNKELPQGQLSMKEISKVWASYLKLQYPKTNIIFSSESYGAYIAEFMNNIEFKNFDIDRSQIQISGSAIRKNPFINWDYIAPAAKGFFTKKIVISGPDNKERQSLITKLAEQFQTQFISNKDIAQISQYNTQKIETKLRTANRIVFIDRNLSNLEKTHTIKSDLTLFYKTNLSIKENTQSEILEIFHKQLLKENQEYQTIKGTWDEKITFTVQLLLKKWPWLKNQLLQ